MSKTTFQKSLEEQSGVKKFAAHCERNKDPILQKLKENLPLATSDAVRVFEVAAGTGQHTAYFSDALGGSVEWTPSDVSPLCVKSITAWAEGLGNVRPCVHLDVSHYPWPEVAERYYEAVLCCNLVHVAPPIVMERLVRGAARAVKPGGKLFIYGPFSRGGDMVESNKRFDETLRARDPSFGIRSLEELTEFMVQAGFETPVVHDMPANNLLVVASLVEASDKRRAEVFLSGHFFPPACSLEKLRFVREEMAVRDDDVFIATFPKAGTHLFQKCAHVLRCGPQSTVPLPQFPLEVCDADKFDERFQFFRSCF